MGTLRAVRDTAKHSILAHMARVVSSDMKSTTDSNSDRPKVVVCRVRCVARRELKMAEFMSRQGMIPPT